MPVNVYWDTDESRLLAVEVKSMQQSQELRKIPPKAGRINNGNYSIESEVMVLFFSDKSNLNILETRSLVMGEQLINLCVPNVVNMRIKASNICS